MSWNFRVMRHTELDKESGRKSQWLAIHEVYYEGLEVNDLAVTSDEVGYTDRPVTMTAESVEELRFMLERMLGALQKPILEYKDAEK